MNRAALTVFTTFMVSVLLYFHAEQQVLVAQESPKRQKWEYATFGSFTNDPKHYGEKNGGLWWYWNGPDGEFRFKNPSELWKKIGLTIDSEKAKNNEFMVTLNSLGHEGWEVVKFSESVKLEHHWLNERVLLKRTK